MRDNGARRLAKRALKRAAVYVEDFGVQGGDIDDGDRILRAADEAPEGARLILDPDKSKRSPYEIRNIDITKNLSVELNGVSIWANPYAVQKPLFNFKGTLGPQYLLTADVISKWSRTITVSGASSLFQKYDPIIIGDNFVTQPWTSGEGTNPYNGRYEINSIASITGDTITLNQQTEWPYAVANGAFVQKVNFLVLPELIGSGAIIREIDPGVASPVSGASPGKGHLFQFEYCLGAALDGVNVQGWQMHVVNNHLCLRTTISRVNAVNAFRPSVGGHGYVMRDDNSLATLAEKCYGYNGRHGIDWSRSYDGVSRNNVMQNMQYAAYYTHGTGTKRIKSIDDTVLGGIATAPGWGHGDPGFNSDYGWDIIRPKYRGIGVGISSVVGSEDTRVFDPDILTRGDAGILVTRGVKNFYLDGGIIENYNTNKGPSGLVVDITSDGSAPVAYPVNVTIKKTRFRSNSKVVINALGKVDIDGIVFEDTTNIPADSGAGAALTIGSTQACTDLSVRNVDVRGVFDRGIYTSLAPSGQYEFRDNHVGPGYRSGGVQLRSAPNLRYERNVITDNGIAAAENLSSATSVTADKRIGAVFRHNSPGVNDSNSYSTANRPSAKAIGESCFDTDLSKPIYVKTLGTKETDLLQITTGATADGNVTINLSSNAFTVAVLTGDTPIQIADKIRARSFLSNNWYAKGTPGTDTVAFISAINGDRTGTFSYVGGTTGSAGTMTTNSPAGTGDVWVDAAGTVV